jgi:hypothetical protein
MRALPPFAFRGVALIGPEALHRRQVARKRTVHAKRDRCAAIEIFPEFQLRSLMALQEM